MDETTEKVLQNWRVIRELKKNERLNTKSSLGIVSINSDLGWPFTSVRRWFDSDGRDKTTNFLQHLLSQSQGITHEYIETLRMYKKTSLDENEHQYCLKKCRFLERLWEAYQESKIGLNNLMATYNSDASVRSIITTVIESIEYESMIIVRGLNDYNSEEYNYLQIAQEEITNKSDNDRRNAVLSSNTPNDYKSFKKNTNNKKLVQAQQNIVKRTSTPKPPTYKESHTNLPAPIVAYKPTASSLAGTNGVVMTNGVANSAPKYNTPTYSTPSYSTPTSQTTVTNYTQNPSYTAANYTPSTQTQNPSYTAANYTPSTQTQTQNPSTKNDEEAEVSFDIWD